MNDQNKTVWIDMDGTIFDFDGAALEVVPAELRVPKKHFYIANDYPEPLRTQIIEKYNSPGFFANLQIFPGAIEGWQALIDAGYHPRILSSPLSSSPDCVAEKRESLERHLVPVFGQSVLDEAIIDTEKWNYPGLVLIDDRPDIVRDGALAPWKHVLYGWSHMDSVEDAVTTYRLRDWSEIDILLDILSKITEQQ